MYETVKVLGSFDFGEDIRVKKVIINTPYGDKKMIEFYVLVNGEEIFLRRDEDWGVSIHTLYDLYRGLYKDKGYIKVYANEDKKNPLDEFDGSTIICNYGSPLEKIKEGVWKFGGNHEEYSGAFYYIIWNEKLAKEIEKRLLENDKGNR